MPDVIGFTLDDGTTTQVMDDFRKLARSPQEIEIGFGVTLDGKLGGVIASVSSDRADDPGCRSIPDRGETDTAGLR